MTRLRRNQALLLAGSAIVIGGLLAATIARAANDGVIFEGAVGNLVYADPEARFHILVVVFPEGTSSGIHLHGCWGVIGYLQGGDEETRYRWRDGRPVEESRHVWHQGDITYLLPDGMAGPDGRSGCWHRVRNPGPGVGVSVHVLCRTPVDHPEYAAGQALGRATR